MGLFSKKVEAPHDPFFDALLSMTGSDTFAITANQLQNSDVYTAITRISNDLASCMLLSSNKIVEKLFNEQPNNYTDPTTFMNTIAMRLLLYGNTFVEIITSNGTPDSLNVLDNSSVTVLQDDSTNKITYEYTTPRGKVRRISAKSMLHFKINSIDGATGVSPLQSLKDEIMIQRSGNKLLRDFYSNGILGTKVLTIKDAKLNEDAREAIKEKFNEANRSNTSAIILDSDMSISNLTVNTDILKLTNGSNDWISRQIAKAYKLPNFMLGIEDEHSNQDQTRKNYLSDCLRHYMDAITAELAFKWDADFSFDVSNLESLDPKETQAMAIEALQGGILTVNEAREKIGLKKLPDGDQLQPTTNRNEMN